MFNRPVIFGGATIKYSCLQTTDFHTSSCKFICVFLAIFFQGLDAIMHLDKVKENTAAIIEEVSLMR